MWRLVDSGLLAPAMSAAVDEAMLEARILGEVPNTLHLYRRDRPAVSLGHFSRVGESVDLEEAERLGVAVVRRMSGGNAVFTDPGQFIYTVIIDGQEVQEDPQDTFRVLCQGIVVALGELGVEAEFKPVNDVLVGGRKISGSAQIRRGGMVAQHGTLMVRNDYERMFAVLLNSKRDRNTMTSLAEEMTPVPTMAATGSALIRGFSEVLGVDLVPDALTDTELHMAKHLAGTVYGDPRHVHLH
jgi:lipoate---protein ligase